MCMLSTLAMIIGGIWLLMKAVPILIKIALYCVAAVMIVFAIRLLITGFSLMGGLLIVLLVYAVVKLKGSSYSGSSYYSSDYSGGSSYVLNKKTGVIHDRWDSSVDTISEHHRRDISYSEAQELVNRGTRYRFKQYS